MSLDQLVALAKVISNGDIGPILPDSLLSPASALKFGRVIPAPVMTKRMTALTLITKGSWPVSRYSVQNALPRKKHHQPKELNSGIAHSDMRFGYHGYKEGSGLPASFLLFFCFSKQIIKY